MISVIASKDLERRKSGRLTSRAATMAPYAVTVLLCALFLSSFLDLPHHSLRYPISVPTADCLFESALVKGILQTGWYTSNPYLGAPQGFQLYDFPMAEATHVAVIKFFGVFSGNWAVVMNLFYLAQYLLTSLIALFVFRQLRLPSLPSMAASLLFAFLPYHYLRGEYHLFLAAYYLVPLMVLVLIWIAKGEPLIVRTSSRLRYRVTPKGAYSFGICILVGGGGVYYAFFAALFLVTIAFFTLSQSRGLTRAAEAFCCVATICAVVLGNLLPSFLYWLRNGANGNVAKRLFVEADMYGLTFAQLLLPVHNHRIARLAALKSTYLTSVKGIIPTNDLMAPLGIVTSLGFLLLIGVALFGTWRLPRKDILRPLAAINLVAVITATLGGFGSLFALLISPQIRCYDRISIYIAFFSLTALLAAIDGIRFTGSRPRLTACAVAGIAVLMAAGLFDLTPSTAPSRFVDTASFDRDQAFFAAVEASVPGGSMILQLPYHGFPEQGFTNQMYDYDHFRGYLHSRHLRWSYGVSKGRPADDWQKALAGLPAPQLLQAAQAAGFGGIYIDRLGFKDGAKGLLSALSVTLGQAPLESLDHRLAFLPLAPSATYRNGARPQGYEVAKALAALQLTAAVSGCYDQESDAKISWQWCPSAAEIRVVNTGSDTLKAVIDVKFKTGYDTDSKLTMDGLISDSLAVSVAGKRFRKEVTVPPGTHILRLKSDAKNVVAPRDPRTLVFSVTDFSFKPL